MVTAATTAAVVPGRKPFLGRLGSRNEAQRQAGGAGRRQFRRQGEGEAAATGRRRSTGETAETDEERYTGDREKEKQRRSRGEGVEQRGATADLAVGQWGGSTTKEAEGGCTKEAEGAKEAKGGSSSITKEAGGLNSLNYKGDISQPSI